MDIPFAGIISDFVIVFGDVTYAEISIIRCNIDLNKIAVLPSQYEFNILLKLSISDEV